MGQSAEELRRGIEATRGEMGDTVDAIADQVSPSRIVERRKEQVRSRWVSARESVMGSASDTHASVAGAGDTLAQAPRSAVAQTQGRPMVAGAVAFGVGFLAAAIFPGSQTEGQLAQKVQDMAQPAVDQIKQSGQDAVAALKGPAQEAAGQLKATAMTGVGQVRDTAQGAVGDTKDAASDASQHVKEQAQASSDNVRDT